MSLTSIWWDLETPTLVNEKHSSSFGRDLIETEKAYEVHIDVPGVEPNDVEISVLDKYLEVKAERKPNYDASAVKVHFHERRNDKIHRKLRIPLNADMDKAETKLKHGVLTITIPKKTEEKKEVRKLTIMTE